MSFAQFLSILRARWKLAVGVFAGVLLLALIASLVMPKKYSATASVVVDVKPDPLSGMLMSGAMTPGIIATQIDVLQSDRVAYRVVRNLKLNENPQLREQWMEATEGKGSIEQWLSQVFRKNLDIRPSRESNVINVSYEAPDPRFAATLANAFVQAYLDTAIELRVEPARQYSSFFDVRAKEAREVLEKAQSRLSEFQRQKGIVANDERLDVENARLNELSTQLVALQAVASESGSRNAAARGSADRLPEVLQNPVVANLKADMARTEARLQELQARLGDSHPQVQEAKANIAELRRRIEAETVKVTGSVGVNASINQQRVAELRAALEAQRSKVLQMKDVRDEGSVLLREVENAQRSYDLIMQRLNQMTLESQATQSNVSVLTPADTPTAHTSPNVVRNMMLGVFAGTLLGVAVAIVRELMDRRVRSVEDVVQAVGLPIIGIVPGSSAKRLMGRMTGANLLQQRLAAQVPAGKQGV